MNPFYQSYQKQNWQTNIPGIPADIQPMANMLLQQLAQMGLTPEQKVRQLIQNRQMTQQQFEELGRMADIVIGRSR